MQPQEAVQSQMAEPPVLINTTGLSAEARGLFDLIAKRAYEIFESKGRMKGRELEDWLEAESQLFERTSVEVKQSPEAVTVIADVHNFAPKDIEIDLEPRRVTIIGKQFAQTGRKSEAGGYAEKRATRLLRSLQLPAEIDMQHATVRLEHGFLELDMKKATAAKGQHARARAGGSVA